MQFKFKTFFQRLSSHKLRTAIILFLFVIGIGAFIILRPFFSFAKTNGLDVPFFYNMAFSSSVPLKTTQGKTNIVLLGMGGGTHEGADLTDSMMVISMSEDGTDVAAISLPRDIYTDTIKDRINAAYHYGEEKKQGGGLIMAKSIAEEVVGLPIHYAIAIDFSGFKDIIDLIGGVDINIEELFIDTEYPIANRENDDCGGGDPDFACRYMTVEFKKGIEHMNGDRALIYVRSRHATGREGNDYARGKRQEQVVLAVKDKLLKEKLDKDFSKAQKLLEFVKKTTISDMTFAEMLYLGKLGSGAARENIRYISLAIGGENGELVGFLENPPDWKYNGMWVLVPRTGNFDEIHAYVNCQIFTSNCSIPFPEK